MSNILLAGDSWGIGVFAGVGENYGPTGQGIQSILETQGYSVINISKAGASNENIINNISENLQMVDHIIFLQTDDYNCYLDVKQYVKSVFGANSPQYKQVSGLEFKVIKKD